MTQPTTLETRTPAPSKAAYAFALVVALLVVGLLGFTAYAKSFYPNKGEVMIEGLNLSLEGHVFDRGIAAFELFVAVMLLGLHRFWGAWMLNALLFGALGGYSLFKSWHGESCGCFAKLWSPPPYSMFAVDVVIVLVSMLLSLALRAPKAIIPVTLAGSLVTAAAGWAASDATTPPKRAETALLHAGKLAHARLLESELLRDVREQPEGGPAWLICAFDPACHICEAMKPLIQFKQDEYTENADPILQIRQFSIPDLVTQVGIEAHAWETPTIFVVSNGAITRLWSGKALEDFTPERLDAIYSTLEAGGYPPEEAPPLVAPAPPAK